MPKHNAAFDYLRAGVTVLVLAHHSTLAYATWGYFNPQHYLWSTGPIVDTARWRGFDIFILFNDVFFMSLMFFISGLFVWQSLKRKGVAAFVRDRVLRLGIPFAVVVTFLMPLAYYPSFHLTGSPLGYLQYWQVTLFAGPWPCGPAWFVWLLLAFGCVAAMLTWIVPGWGDRLATVSSPLFRSPALFFAALVAVTAAAYVPMLLAYGPTYWFPLGPFAIQASRVLLYAAYFFAGAIAGAYGIERGFLSATGPLARAWLWWLAIAAAVFTLVVAAQGFAQDVSAAHQALYGMLFVVSCAATGFALLAVFQRFVHTRSRVWDSLKDNAYAMYLIHYPFVVWAQFALLRATLPAGVKAGVVFAVTLALSWASSVALRRIPAIGRYV